MNSNEMRKLPFWKKFTYGCGAGGGIIMSQLIGSFLLSYYTDTAGIAAAAIGTMFVVARLLDGVSDFAMGGIVDKTHTKIGKARPWIILAAPLMAIGIILLLSVPQSWSDVGKVVYAYVTYIFLNCIVYTIFGIAHTALLARMTRDYKDRNTTSTVSAFINNLLGILVGVIVPILLVNVGWAITGIVLGICAGGLILVTGLTCDEVVGMDAQVDDNAPKVASIPMKDQIAVAFKNKYFWFALMLGVIILLMNSNAATAMTYYCNVVLNDPLFLSTLMGIGMAPAVIVLFITPYCFNKFSKRTVMVAGSLLLVLGFAICIFAGENRVMLVAGTAIRSFGLGPVFAGLYAFCADAADYGEWKFGVRSEGLMSASQSIGAKVGMGFGAALPAWILSAVGYTQGAASEAVVKAVSFDYGWMGAILSAVMLVFVLLMDVEKHLPEIRAELEAKNKK